MPPTDVAERLRAAAFELFAEQGYDATTVDHIAERAGVGRSTFFRAFRAKEDVIFPDHEQVLARIEERFAAASTEHSLLAVTDASRLVLRSFLADADRARERYALTRAVPSLRQREIASMQQYQRAFREFIRSWMDETEGSAALTDLRAELMAAAVVTAHNHVLRHWLRDPRGSIEDVEAAFEQAMGEVRARFAAPRHGDDRVTVVVSGSTDPEAVAEQVRRALREGGPDRSERPGSSASP